MERYRRRGGTLVLLVIPTLLLLISACGPQPLTVTREPVQLHIVAAGSCASLVEDLASAYEETTPWATIEVTRFNAAIAEEYLRNGRADLAVLSWVTTAPPPLWTSPFATDAAVIVAHPEIDVDNLNLSQLQDIFRGRVGEWADGTPIQVVSREAGAGTRAAFESHVMGNSDVTLSAVVMPSNDRVVNHVASTPGAIGYVSLDTRTNGVRVIPIEGIRPGRDTTSSYPLSYPLYLAASDEPAGETQALIQWMQGDDGQRWVEQHVGPLPTQ